MSELSPKVSASVEKNWATMLKNFSKISSWFKSGAESKHELPEVIRDWLAEYAKLQSLVSDLSSGYNAQNKLIKALNKRLDDADLALEDSTKVNKYLSQRLDKLEQLIAELDAPAALATVVEDSKPVTKATTKAKVESEPKAKVEKKEEIELTAEAIEVGDVSPEALEALDNIAADLQADLDDLDAL